jgi:hypothetical protein
MTLRKIESDSSYITFVGLERALQDLKEAEMAPGGFGTENTEKRLLDTDCITYNTWIYHNWPLIIRFH